MSFDNYVSGGTGSPKVELLNKDNSVLQSFTLPEEGLRAIAEEFAPVENTHQTISNKLLKKNHGYRYGVTVKYDYLTLAGYRLMTLLYNHYRNQGKVRFYPHQNRDDIFYDCILTTPFQFPYVSGKMVGYAGKFVLEGIELLSVIPCDSKVWYFTSIEGDYSPDEVSHFSSISDDYEVGEASYWSACPEVVKQE